MSEAYSWEGTEPNDPNLFHLESLRKLEKLYQNMPEGWIRNTDFSKSKAPYIHVASGKESFRHPNRPEMDTLVKEMRLAEQADKENSALMHSQTNKFCRMLQAGVPIAAVEQKARLEGINLASLLGRPKESSSTDLRENPLPARSIEKYKRMIQRGVPLNAVQAQAYLDGQWTPQQVAEALEGVLDVDNDIHKEHYAAPTCRAKKRPRPATSSDSQPHTYHTYFTPEDRKVSFPGNSILASLVRNMAHTVHKRAISSPDSTLVVDSLTLYHALGAFLGVQVARDSYNSTCDVRFGAYEIKAKRQAFSEIASSIGLQLPQELASRVQIDGLDELVRYIETEFEKELAEKQNLLGEGRYDFDSLALLYPPGTKVVAKNAGGGGGGVDMICQVAWNRFEQGRTILGKPTKYFKVCFQYVVALGPCHATLAEVVEGMESFEGHRQIHSALMFVPLAAYSAEKQERLLDRYRRRGQVYNQVALRGKHAYMSYEKGSFFLKRGGNNVDSSGNSAAALANGGRVIVDTQGAYDHGHSLGFGYDSMIMGIKYKFKEYSLHLRSIKQERKSHGKAVKKVSDDGLILFDQVPFDFLDMVWPAVVGFSLTAKAWGDVLVDGLDEIEWQEDIFDRLVLPENRKTMVKALVRHSSNLTFEDLVEGKGKGTIFLLCGPPGVGKTLTAEAVAELVKKPLYSLSLGTLGTTPGEFEQRLGQIMNLCAKWDALILLDEADSFLETRSSSSSLERNAMVSIMLKLVEYFSGIMFLTSNRIDSMDPAFRTRITLALRYEELNLDSRTKVWTSLLIKSGFKSELEEGMIDPSELAKACLNGREIKNALRLAMAMATEKEQPLSQAILLETVDIVNDYKTTLTNPYAEEDDAEKKKGQSCFFPWWG